MHESLPSNALDLSSIRAAFPGLNSETVYLDNAGGTQVLKRVADRISEYMLTTSVQLGASYRQSRLADEKVLEARRSVAELVNAYHDDEVVFGGSSTQLLFMLVQSLLPGIRPGDEIILTNTDHEANIGAWTRLAAAGAVVKFWNINTETLKLETDDLDRLLSPRVKWLSMTSASNILGQINPVAEVIRRVHAVGGKVCLDCVAYAPHRLIDVRADLADVIVFSFYKLFGPHNAMMWARRSFLQSLANLNHDFIGMDESPYHLQPGGINYELSYGCIGISDYFVDVGNALGLTGTRRECMQGAFRAFELHEDVLAERLLGWLRGRPGIRIIGDETLGPEGRIPIVSFVIDGTDSETIVRHMDRFDIGIRFGDFYARRLIEALGIAKQGGVVRVSVAHYNVVEEMDRLIEHLAEII